MNLRLTISVDDRDMPITPDEPVVIVELRDVVTIQPWYGRGEDTVGLPSVQFIFGDGTMRVYDFHEIVKIEEAA